MTSQNIDPATLAQFENRKNPESAVRDTIKIEQLLVNPDIICSAEYRAIYDCIKDVVGDYDDKEKFDVAAAMLKEFIEQAKWAKKRLKKLRKISQH